jgi:hypothetical protein
MSIHKHAQIAVMWKMADALCASLQQMSLSVHDGPIKAMIERDVDHIVYCNQTEAPSLTSVVDNLSARQMGDNIGMRARFKELYPNEQILYRDMIRVLSMRVGSNFDLMEIMPLIDEYIDLICSVY